MRDSVTRKRVTEFVRNVYFNQQSIIEYKREWDTISTIGRIVFEDVEIVLSDSCSWSYLLPVVSKNAMVAIVMLPILNESVVENGKCKIALRLDNRIAKPELIKSIDKNFGGLSFYFKKYKTTKTHPQTKSIENELFFYSYTLQYYSYIDGNDVVVVGSGRGMLDEMLDYYRIVGGLKFRVSSIGGGYFCLEFEYWYPGMSYEYLRREAYEFGNILSNRLEQEGSQIRVYPLFGPDGGINPEGGGGGSGGSGTINPEGPCLDTKCTKCGGCINASRPSCVKCTCCRHTLRCQSVGCGKLIRTNTRAAMNCSHAESDFCPSSGPVCECGERHVDDNTKYPKCRKLIGMILDNNGNKGYLDMWDWSVENARECAGYLLDNGQLCVYFYAKNKFRRSHNGDIVLCERTNTKYAITGTEQTIEDLFRYPISKPVHTHPEKDVKFDSISSQGIKGYNLALSEDFDLKNLVENKFLSGYVLSKKATEVQGYVFEYMTNSLQINTYCTIVGRF